MEQTYLGPTSTPNVRFADSSSVNEKTESKQSTEKKPPVSDQSSRIAQTILKKKKKEVSQSHSDFPPKQSKSKEEVSTSAPKSIEELLVDSQDLGLKQKAQELVSQAKAFEFAYGSEDKKSSASKKQEKEPGSIQARKELVSKTQEYLAPSKEKHLSEEDQAKKTIELYSALYQAVQEEERNLLTMEMEEGDRDKLTNALTKLKSEYEKKIIANDQKLEKLKNAPLKFNALSSRDHIPSNDPLKFTCTAIQVEEAQKSEETKKPSYPYKKASESKQAQQAWAKEHKAALKEFKQTLKNALAVQIEKSLPNDNRSIEDMKKPSFILGKIRDRFKELHEELNKTSDPSVQVKILNEIVELMDLADDMLDFVDDKQQISGFKDFYMEYAQGLYKKSSESFHKKLEQGEVTGKYNPILDPSDVEALKVYTGRAVNIFDHVISLVQGLEETKLNKIDLTSHVSFEEVSKRVSDYFKTLIRMHKGLSHSRFTELFNIHQRFANRLAAGLALLEQDKQQSETVGFVHDLICSNLMPQITLQETTKHRSSQGRHPMNTTEGRHKYLRRQINPYVGWLTIGSTLSFEKYECAHVVAFPGLFANRRNTSSEIGKQHVRRAYYETSQEEAVIADINAIHKKYGHDPVQYAEHLLDLTLRLAMEESSKTVHLPSIFNQEVDGVSEKHIKMQDLKEEERGEIEQTYKELHSTKEEASTSPVATKGETTTSQPVEYTKKIYKFILAHNIFNIIGDVAKRSNAKTYEEVLRQEENYIRASKLSLASRIKALQGRAEHMNEIEKLVVACALINVFYGIKNAEANAGVDLTEGDKEVLEAIQELKQTMEKSK